MLKSTHLSRIEEKKARRRIYYSIGLLLLIVVVLYLGAVPLLTKFSLILVSTNKEKTDANQTSNLPLLPPHLDPLEEATNSATIAVRGFANEGETVKLIVNGNEENKVLVGKDGKFKIDEVRLNEGDNKINATTIKDSKESSVSETIDIVYKKTLPTLDISAPSDNQSFFGDTKTVNITGKTDADTKITINDRLVLVNSDGTFSSQLSLNAGDNQIKIVATDIAGNQTTVQRKVTYKP